MQYSVCSMQFAVFSVQCAVCRTQCNIYYTLCSTVNRLMQWSAVQTLSRTEVAAMGKTTSRQCTPQSAALGTVAQCSASSATRANFSGFWDYHKSPLDIWPLYVCMVDTKWPTAIKATIKDPGLDSTNKQTLTKCNFINYFLATILYKSTFLKSILFISNSSGSHSWN